MKTEIKIKELTEKDIEIKNIKKMYYKAFPEDERIPFDSIKFNMFPESKKVGIYDALGKLVGFAFESKYKSILYLAYFTIEKKYRRRGFGSEFLKQLKDEYPNSTIVFSVEKPHEVNDIPNKRIEFYRRNGFDLANFEFKYGAQSYLIMSNKKINMKDLQKFLDLGFPGTYDHKKLDCDVLNFQIRFEKITEDNFDVFYKYYLETYEKWQRRTKTNCKEVLAKENYEGLLIYKDKTLLGFLCSWKLPDFNFVEYFTIIEKHRNKGYGVYAFLDYLHKSKVPVVFEVEPPIAEVEKGKIKFYKALGCVLTHVKYTQPSYPGQIEGQTLRIMYYTNGKKPKLRRNIETIKQVVYDKK